MSRFSLREPGNESGHVAVNDACRGGIAGVSSDVALGRDVRRITCEKRLDRVDTAPMVAILTVQPLNRDGPGDCRRVQSRWASS